MGNKQHTFNSKRQGDISTTLASKNTISTKSKNISNKFEIDKNHYEKLYIIGRGGFGRVWKVSSKKDHSVYAMKEMAKAKIIDKKSENSVKYERTILSQIKHPFIVNMHYAFQDFENLYIIMDYLIGGDMRYNLTVQKSFNEEQTSKLAI